MSELKGKPGELSFIVTIKRAATGLEETYQMVGHVLPASQSPEPKESKDDSHPQRSGA